ncbi:hypothetical protein UVI_02039320 [Ustilaginoidea virens]|uniref:Uncharacterized protein n=1 Tax=Ustilaginoidea virens TaxID=1159556 RepID=A0A1B5KXX0_USTVR|nr:hypothetical protein UVI_02039320 [Ustilaginoidea virens]
MGSKASSALRDHPGAANHALVGIAARHCGELDASSTSASASAPGARPGSKHALGAQLKACKALTDHELWAISPLPQILCEVSICLAREHNYAYAVAVSALAAVACDPYRHVAPFHVVRLKNLLAVVKLLVLTAEESAALRTSPRATASSPTTGGGGLDDEARQALARIDQVSLSQMLLVMIARMEPAGCRGEWSPCVAAREMLEDIGRLDGREKELSLIDAWRHDGGSDASTRFFEYAVVEQMAALAELGRSVLREEFGQQRVNVNVNVNVNGKTASLKACLPLGFSVGVHKRETSSGSCHFVTALPRVPLLDYVVRTEHSVRWRI